MQAAHVKELVMAEFAEVVSQAMGLPIERRADLAHRLIISLEQQRTESEETLEEVLVQRQQRVRGGDYATFEASETLDRIKQALDERSKS